MKKTQLPTPDADLEPRGLARDFAVYADLERERRRNSYDDFEPQVFDEAVALVLQKLRA